MILFKSYNMAEEEEEYELCQRIKNLEDYLEKKENVLKILVIGDSCTDIFIYGSCQRLNPEAPIPIFEPSKTITNDGMAGNVVRNFKSVRSN